MKNDYFDEMYDMDHARQHYTELSHYLKTATTQDLVQKNILSKKILVERGLDFKTFNQAEPRKPIYPFDIIPRIITFAEWTNVNDGVAQRVKALNSFLVDIYGRQEIIRDDIIPAELIHSCPYFIKEMVGISLPQNIYIHIAGFDLIKDDTGKYVVLEDNLRIPSGVYSSIESRNISNNIFPELIKNYAIQPQVNYPAILLEYLSSIPQCQAVNPVVVILTFGAIASYSYSEQLYLAINMGIPLVEPKDLVVDNNYVFRRTDRGLQRIDIIYRRMDDEYFSFSIRNIQHDQLFDHIFSSYLKGNVVIVNAIGNGVADDKAIYSYVPQMIRYYLNELPILENVKTYRLDQKEEMNLVFKDIDRFVIKKTDGMRGIGMLMGNSSSEEAIEKYKLTVSNNPRNFVAQPIINFSKLSCFIDEKLTPRRIDLRPYTLLGPNGVKVMNTALTRVALNEDSYDVSSPHGCRKDTWILKRQVLK